jgi:hypothetical protein
MIRIDEHPVGENLIHTTHMLTVSVHLHHSYVFYGQFAYMTTIHIDPTELDRFITPEKKCSRLHLPGWVARGTRLSYSPNTTIEAVHLSQVSVDE